MGLNVVQEEKSQRRAARATAGKVQSFYDSHPYPPPVTELDGYRQAWQDEGRRRADFHLFFPDRPYQEELTILVAGCGTSQAAKYALRQPAAHVVGIDVSSTSIGYTAELKRRYGLSNLELHQLPLERAPELGRRFDKIVCTGVLHHLPDPDRGLRALREVLAPRGALHLMVYAAYGRYGVYMLQEYARLLGVGESDAEIGDFAGTLMALPLDHPLARLLAESPDFKSRAGLADALLHPQDRAYTVPQLFELLDGAGLRFGRWLRQAPYLPQCGDLARTPHGGRLRQLAPREQYAAVELFRGTMLRHSLVVHRDDGPSDSPAIHFDDDSWLGYVPLRLPGTRTVREQSPPGARAALINQNHSYPDLYLPITAKEERLLEAIDGQRAVGEIVNTEANRMSGEPDLERVRGIFEQLWWYDQVVFDSSPRPA